MKALVLGATGMYGSEAARLLCSTSSFDEIYIGSRDLSKASDLAGKLGEKATPVLVDLGDLPRLDETVANVNVVVNANGAALQTALPAIHSAVRMKKNYCDLSAEADVLLQAEKHSQEIRASGITVLLGAGHHPGVLDLLGVKASMALDELKSVDMYIAGTLADYADPDTIISAVDAGWGGTEGLKTIIYSTGADSISVAAGKRVTLAAGEHQFTVRNPEGIALDFTHWASMEALSIHRAFPEIDGATISYGLWPRSGQSAMVRDCARVCAEEMKAAEVIRAMFQQLKVDNTPPPRIQFWATATGTRGNKSCTATAYSVEDWASNRSILATTTRGLAFAAEALARDQITKKGLATCPEAFAPDDYFAAVAPEGKVNLCVEVVELI